MGTEIRDSSMSRLALLGAAAPIVTGLLDLAPLGLSQMFLKGQCSFVQTSRFLQHGLTREGQSLRYTAIAALGIATLNAGLQRDILGGMKCDELVRHAVKTSGDTDDPGALALVAWASAEVCGEAATGVLARLRSALQSGLPLPTVDTAWMLTAALAGPETPDSDPIVQGSSQRLLQVQGPGGLFPHALPPSSLGRLRSHVGCFADQVYPIQALARLFRQAGDSQAIEAANRCARQICRLQGDAGQWWWHYDSRGESVVEGFPVYSVHQHAMAPMALFDLLECGGSDHRDEILAGLQWLRTHPEVSDNLIDPERGVVWRKVGRREPAKAVRKVNAVLTALQPRLRLPAADLAFPATVIDRECRPYELGWLLYVWNRGHSPYQVSPVIQG